MKKLTLREWILLGTTLVTILGAVTNYAVEIRYQKKVMHEMQAEINWCSATIWHLKHPETTGPPPPPPSLMMILEE